MNLPTRTELGKKADRPVEGNGAQVEDGGGAAEDVSCQPDLAGDGPEDPFPQHRVGNVQGEHRDGNLASDMRGGYSWSGKNLYLN